LPVTFKLSRSRIVAYRVSTKKRCVRSFAGTSSPAYTSWGPVSSGEGVIGGPRLPAARLKGTNRIAQTLHAKIPDGDGDSHEPTVVLKAAFMTSRLLSGTVQVRVVSFNQEQEATVDCASPPVRFSARRLA
jgi:hypothetical protein